MKNDKLKQNAHVLAALIFILLAFYVFEDYDIMISCIFIAAGSAFVIIAASHEWLMSHHRSYSKVFIFVEAAAMFCGACFFFLNNHKFLYTALGISAGVFLILGTYFLFTKKKRSHRHRSKHRRNRLPDQNLLC